MAKTLLEGWTEEEYRQWAVENKNIARTSGLREAVPEEARMNFEDQKMPKIEGYAALFNRKTELFKNFYEQIAPGAFTSALASGNDVRATLNHDPSLVFASTKSDTLHLTQDSRGLKYEVYPIPEIDTADRVKKLIKMGIIRESSFAFTIEEQRMERMKNGTGVVRTILKVNPLMDVSPVTYPAYSGTNVFLRMNEGHVELDEVIVAPASDTVVQPPSDEDLFKQCDELLKGAFRR